MSLCRFSDNNFKCDIYCYEDVKGGFTTHVAAARYKKGIPHIGLGQTLNEQIELLRKCEMTNIELPCAGKIFHDTTIKGVLKRLVRLKKLGYRFPVRVIRDLQREAK